MHLSSISFIADEYENQLLNRFNFKVNTKFYFENPLNPNRTIFPWNWMHALLYSTHNNLSIGLAYKKFMRHIIHFNVVLNTAIITEQTMFCSVLSTIFSIICHMCIVNDDIALYRTVWRMQLKRKLSIWLEAIREAQVLCCRRHKSFLF